MKAVIMTADEILAAIQTRLRTIGLAKAFGEEKRRRRVATKLMGLALGARAVRVRNECRRATLLAAVGACCFAMRERRRELRTAKVALAGYMMMMVRLRDAARRACAVAVVGCLLAAIRKRNRMRRVTLIFAAGVVPMWARVLGSVAPKGYVYGQRPKPKALHKGPKVRGIHWDTLSETKGTIWGKQGPAKNPMNTLKELFPDLKSIFTEVERVKKVPKAIELGPDGLPIPPKVEVAKVVEVTFVDPKESQKMAIALSKFKSLPGFKEGARFRVVRDALDAMDEESIMGQDGLEILDKNMPTAAMLEAAKPHGEAAVPTLAFVENYVWELSQVKLLMQRIKCMRLKSTLGENMLLVENDLTIFAAAASEILDSPRLVEFLVDVVRPFGNELNRAGGKKDALGIKISGLIKLGATRTADNSMTSLFYIVSVLVKHRPALLDICHEFNQCKAAMRLTLSGLEGNFKAIKDAAALAKGGMEVALKANDVVFVDKMGPMTAKVVGAVDALESRLVTLKANLARAAEYLGEKDRDQNKPEGLFSDWFGFIELFSNTYAEFRAKREKEAKKVKEEAAKIKVAQEQAAKAAARAALGDSAPPPKNPRAAGRKMPVAARDALPQAAVAPSAEVPPVEVLPVEVLPMEVLPVEVLPVEVPPAAPAGVAVDALPDDWVEATDPASGRVYFANPVSGKTSWERPKNEEAAAPQEILLPSEVPLSDMVSASAS